MNVTQWWLVPRPGLIVRFPGNKVALPADGAWCSKVGPEGRYWRRRLAVGDVTLGSPPPDPAPEIQSSRAAEQKEED
ncbi:MAG: DUF2635 domain-containing protein [Desulforudis sp.]|jgi:hypothetical protein|nr:MAG: DUF2635 domain-containing protein [Desulforudis sp.]